MCLQISQIMCTLICSMSQLVTPSTCSFPPLAGFIFTLLSLISSALAEDRLIPGGAGMDAILLGERLYMSGGLREDGDSDSDSASGNVYYFESGKGFVPTNPEWVENTNAHHELYFHKIAPDGGFSFLITGGIGSGGQPAGAQNSNDAMYVSTCDGSSETEILVDGAEPGANIPQKRAHHGLAYVIEGTDITTYLYGGATGESVGESFWAPNGDFLNDFWEYHRSRNEWKRIESSAEAPQQLAGHALAELGGKLIVIGGQKSASIFLEMSDVHVYDRSSWSWSHFHIQGDVPTPRSNFGHCTIGNFVFITGGVGDNQELFNDVWALEYKNDQYHWHQQWPPPDDVVDYEDGPKTIPTGRLGHAMVCAGTHLLAIQGLRDPLAPDSGTTFSASDPSQLEMDPYMYAFDENSGFSWVSTVGAMANTQNYQVGNSLSVEAIIGLAAGITGGLIFVAGFAWWARRKQKRKKKKHDLTIATIPPWVASGAHSDLPTGFGNTGIHGPGLRPMAALDPIANRISSLYAGNRLVGHQSSTLGSNSLPLPPGHYSGSAPTEGASTSSNAKSLFMSVIGKGKFKDALKHRRQKAHAHIFYNCRPGPRVPIDESIFGGDEPIGDTTNPDSVQRSSKGPRDIKKNAAGDETALGDGEDGEFLPRVESDLTAVTALEHQEAANPSTSVRSDRHSGTPLDAASQMLYHSQHDRMFPMHPGAPAALHPNQQGQAHGFYYGAALGAYGFPPHPGAPMPGHQGYFRPVPFTAPPYVNVVPPTNARAQDEGSATRASSRSSRASQAQIDQLYGASSGAVAAAAQVIQREGQREYPSHRSSRKSRNSRGDRPSTGSPDVSEYSHSVPVDSPIGEQISQVSPRSRPLSTATVVVPRTVANSRQSRADSTYGSSSRSGRARPSIPTYGYEGSPVNSTPKSNPFRDDTSGRASPNTPDPSSHSPSTMAMATDMGKPLMDTVQSHHVLLEGGSSRARPNAAGSFHSKASSHSSDYATAPRDDLLANQGVMSPNEVGEPRTTVTTRENDPDSRARASQSGQSLGEFDGMENSVTSSLGGARPEMGLQQGTLNRSTGDPSFTDHTHQTTPVVEDEANLPPVTRTSMSQHSQDGKATFAKSSLRPLDTRDISFQIDHRDDTENNVSDEGRGQLYIANPDSD